MKPYEPVPRRILSLARRPRLRQLLCSLQGSPEMGVGSLLARRRLLLLDHMPGHSGVAAHQRFVRRAQAAVVGHPLVDLILWRDVGLWRPYLRADDALPRHVPGHERGAGLLLGVRHADPAD